MALVWVAIILGRAFIKQLGLLGPVSITTLSSAYLFIIAIVFGISIVAVIIYVSLRIDWAKIIGKWFPWTLEEREKGEGDESKAHG